MKPSSFSDPLIRRPIFLVAAVLGLLTALPAHAVRYYDVEMILFENTDLSQVNNEVWPEVGSVGEPSALDLFGTSEALPAVDPRFAQLGTNGKRLGGTWARLRRSANYRPIMHLAWRQPGLGTSKAIPIRIAGGRRYLNPEADFIDVPGPSDPAASSQSSQAVSGANSTATALGEPSANAVINQPPAELDELEGTIRVVLGRYLHVHTDLVFRRIMPSQFGIQPDPLMKTAASGEDANSSVTQGNFTEPEQPANKLTSFRMQQRRRMRSSELHYIDHPAFGIIVEIRRSPVGEG
ncbi:MAG: CsiV family protein [Gammaproteobacteria bacterium]